MCDHVKQTRDLRRGNRGGEGREGEKREVWGEGGRGDEMR